MQSLGLNEIRERYLKFFESKGHLRLPSFPLVPQNDSSLLLINAGMAPLKPYFTGKEVPPSKRVTTCQKCIRVLDIEEVGKTARHGTFFEMLGNFSFGDYFKHEATKWAWEFITKDLEIPVDRLWVSIYEEDDEARDIWVNEVGVDPSRIVRLGKEDNFWEIGQGPCGPCSEIYFDRGEEHGCGKPDCAVGCDCDRFVEFWNLVFTQFDKDEDGNYNRLAHPNIDTGMGMERLACIMQGVDNIFEVDTVRNIMAHISSIAGVRYKETEKNDISLRIITDHIRGTTFMISDGVLPSNEGRGYVLRRLIRRAARHGKLLGVNKPFLFEVVDTVIRENAGAYPELLEKADFIKMVVSREEENFDKTIDAGLDILNGYVQGLKDSEKDVLSGEDAFRLYDTYGFPIDLTLEILEENGMKVDRDGFNALMEQQRVRARNARKDMDTAGWDEGIYSQLPAEPTEFIGYDKYECTARVLAIIAGNELRENAQEGEEVSVLLDKTVFYGESGGQVGDSGELVSGSKVEVKTAQKLADGKILHIGTVTNGYLEVGDSVSVKINVVDRMSTTRNHSATHLLQKALRDVLGTHVAQSGSLVTPEKLRFDFTHFSPVTAEELMKVEDAVNTAILNSLDVVIEYKDIEQAKAEGAMALFGEKYGKTVRMVKMGDYSTELCGGCHVGNTAQVGLFKIIGESSVAAGIRRIEAVTGMAMLHQLRQTELLMNEVADTLKTTPAEMLTRAQHFMEELKSTRQELSKAKSQLAGGSVDSLIQGAQKIGETTIITAVVNDLDMSALRELGDRLREKLSDAVVVLGTAAGDKVNFITMATKDAVAKGANAGAIIKDVAKIAGGGGGGKPESAQAGGKDPSKLREAIDKAFGFIEAQLKK